MYKGMWVCEYCIKYVVLGYPLICSAVSHSINKAPRYWWVEHTIAASLSFSNRHSIRIVLSHSGNCGLRYACLIY